MTAPRPDNEAIFHAARDMPGPARRREYVRDACGGDEARIAHIEAMLAAADTPDSLLDRPAASDPTIIPTVTRIPRMHGLPPMTAAFCVIRVNSPTATTFLYASF